MQTLIVRIEFDQWKPAAIGTLMDKLSGLLRKATGHGETASWQYFPSLEEAKDWEDNGFPS